MIARVKCGDSEPEDLRQKEKCVEKFSATSKIPILVPTSYSSQKSPQPSPLEWQFLCPLRRCSDHLTARPGGTKKQVSEECGVMCDVPLCAHAVHVCGGTLDSSQV